MSLSDAQGRACKPSQISYGFNEVRLLARSGLAARAHPFSFLN